MTYAYDDYILMPTRDLYDTQVMKMAIDAAKDMYDKGQALMENFYKTYGDFMSPFQKDMEYYGSAMNNVRNVVNDAYARGIDLARSPEGRAIIALLSHSIDPGWYNSARANAKVGYSYLDSLGEAIRNGTYDKGYEDWLLQNGGPGLFNEFLTAGKNGYNTWNRSGVSKFQDVNLWTHHLFDNMQLTYDPELSKRYPGFMAYSKNKDTMNKIAASNLMSLANSDYGRYFMARMEAQGLNTEQQLDALQKLVVDSNWEESQVKLVEDPYKKTAYEYTLKQQLDAEKHEQEMEKLYGPNWREDAENGTLSYHGRNNNNRPTVDTSWTARLRTAIYKNMNGTAQYINNLRKGFTTEGAKEILKSKGINNPTGDLIKQEVKKNKLEFNRLITGPLTKEKLELLSQYYSAYLTVPAGPDFLTAMALAANYSPEEKINSIEEVSRRPVTFTSNGQNLLFLTRQSQAAYLGMPLTPGSGSVQLHNHLIKNGISGYIPYNDVSVNKMPLGNNRSSLDINFTVRIKKSALDEFLTKKESQEEGSFDRIMSSIGAKYITTSGKTIADPDDEDNKGKIQWGDIEYVDIPCTRHIDSTDLTDRQIDKYHIESTQTKSSAAKQESFVYDPNNPLYSITN